MAKSFLKCKFKTGRLATLVLWSMALGLTACHEKKSVIVQTDSGKGQQRLSIDLQPLQKGNGAHTLEPTYKRLDGNLYVSYEDVDSTVVLATRSRARVIIHANVHHSAGAESDGDPEFAVVNGSTCAQYTRPTGDPSRCGEMNSAAAVSERRDADWWECSWRLPKREVGWTGDGAEITFEVFNEDSQVSTFVPGPPFSAVVRLIPGKLSTVLIPRPEKPETAPVPKIQVTRAEKSSSVPSAQTPTTPDIPSESSKPAKDLPRRENYVMTLTTSSGTTIKQGRHYSANDPSVSDGSALILNVQYEAVRPHETKLSVEWFVEGRPASYFPAFVVPNRTGNWSRTYDNHTVEVGKHEIRLSVDSEPRDSFVFFVDAPQRAEDSTHAPKQ